MKKLKQLTNKESRGAKILSTVLTYVCIFAVLYLGSKFLQRLPEGFTADPHSVRGSLVFYFALTMAMIIGMPLMIRQAEFRMAKEKLEEMEDAHSTAYADDVIKLSQQAVEMPVALPVAWDCLKEATHGLDIKALDKRRASWLVDSVDDDRRTVKCSLQYIADPMGRKLSQIYPRTIEMVASVDGHGVNTKLRTRYTFATPMDLEAVSEIISKTNTRLNEMIATADRSIKEQRETANRNSAVAQMEKVQNLNLNDLGSIDLPLSLN